MWLESKFLSPTSRSPPAQGAGRAPPRPFPHTPRACLEPLEGRRLLSANLHTGADAGVPTGSALGGSDEINATASPRLNAISDPRGDFLPTYTGAALPGLDVVAHQVTLAGDRVIFFGRMAGPIAPTQDVGGLFLIGMDRGLGTPRFTRGTPLIGPNVRWDGVVRINADGTGNFANQIIGTPPLGVVTILDPADIRIDGNHFTANLPLSLFTPGATLPPEQWTYNLWPRNAVVIGQNQHVSDLAPDDGNSPVQVLSTKGSPDYGLSGADTAPREAFATPGGAVVTAGGAFAGAASVADDVLGTGDDPLLA
jgi:hypothetical protein